MLAADHIHHACMYVNTYVCKHVRKRTEHPASGQFRVLLSKNELEDEQPR